MCQHSQARNQARVLRVVVPAVLLLALAATPPAAMAGQPASVTIAGSLQATLGCSADWQPDCAATHLVLDANDGVWQAAFNLPAGAYDYKAALDDSWDENYGANARAGGDNIHLELAEAAAVKFYYDHQTHWVTSSRNAIIASAPGSFQKALGCAGDWDPGCLRSWLEDPDGDGIYSFTTASLPAGSYETKVALDESWDENYGAGGVKNGPNIAFTVPSDCAAMTFAYDPATHLLAVTASTAPPPQPASVTIAGSLQSELGCAGDWQPECAATHLTLDANDGVWQGAFTVPAGSFEYKAALDGGWAENYGANARRDGPNIPLSLAESTTVKFYYDHQTHWVTSSEGSIIATVPGSFQKALGCSSDWDPGCLRSWLEDPDGDGVYAFSTRVLPAGTYEAKVAIDEGWDENYGAGGAPGGSNISFTVAAPCTEMFFSYDSATHVLTVSAQGAPRGNLSLAQAHWVTRDTIAWKVSALPGTTYALHFAPEGGMSLKPEGVDGGDSVPLSRAPSGLPSAVLEKFPHLAGSLALQLDGAELERVPAMLKGQLAVSAKGPDGALVDATSLQIPGVLDDLYTYEGPLGPTFAGLVPTVRVWAPTARAVRLHLFTDATATTATTVVPMKIDTFNGVWTAAGMPDWKYKHYLFEVEVFVRSTGRVETNLVTDPYSVALSPNSTRSQLVDLDDADWKPADWDRYKKPRLDAFEDIVLYELHLRDFSAADQSVRPPWRGTYMAFASRATDGMHHLAALARAGVTHVHLLPAFDFATVNENRAEWQQPAGDLAALPPDSEQQQAAVAAVRDEDGFNWGYDPYHYTVPEGSYATDPTGRARVFEFRTMVKSLNTIGLRVVMDVVYNHTTAAGQDARSVLDRIVPGYYHRLDADGAIETSTCCQNTASEHAMMEKLMIDSLLTWARAYKVDGFRFDLMGHHMKSNLLKARDALRALDLDHDGVDGSKIYLYGEGWNFGEVADNARGVNATQLNMAGTGIGTFNDRLRDGARGGGPFSPVRDQGFIDGLLLDPNTTDQGSPTDQKARLLHYADWIRVGLAGNLASYSFTGAAGDTVTGAGVDYNGQPAGYTAAPDEDINYVSAHDNETLFDAVMLKAADGATLAERIRMHNLGVDLVALGQGIPFFHAGDELLRSKSMDRNSYNSGDWFNALDFTYASDNWGVGLPPAEANQADWPAMRPLLADPALKPAFVAMRGALAHFLEAITIRKSSRLFRLPSAEEVAARVRMYNTGPDQRPGLIVMGMLGTWGNCSDFGAPVGVASRPRIVVLFNAAPEAATFTDRELRGLDLKLHPVQARSQDPVVKASRYDTMTGTFTVPGRTTAVFVCRAMPATPVDLP